jgi:hypothetical protein
MILTAELMRKEAESFNSALGAELGEADRQVRYFGWQNLHTGAFFLLLLTATVSMLLGARVFGAIVGLIGLGGFGLGYALLQLIWPGPTQVAPETGRSRAFIVFWVWLTAAGFGLLIGRLFVW